MSVAVIRNPKSQQPYSYSIVHLQNISQRKAAQEALQKAHHELEKRIAARTAQLQQANHLLQEEISKRKEAQAQILASLREKEVLLLLFTTESKTIFKLFPAYSICNLKT